MKTFPHNVNPLAGQNMFVVVPPQSGTSNPTIDMDEIINRIFASEKFEKGVKDMVEALIIAKEMLESTYKNVEVIDNPFDAIYLANLEPDTLSNGDITAVESFSAIQDLSDTIHFNDGWDE